MTEDTVTVITPRNLRKERGEIEVKELGGMSLFTLLDVKRASV